MIELIIYAVKELICLNLKAFQWEGSTVTVNAVRKCDHFYS